MTQGLAVSAGTFVVIRSTVEEKAKYGEYRPQLVRNGAPKETLVCFVCCDTLKVRRVTEKRNFGEKPGYYLCNVCVKTYKHERPENTVLIHHGALGRFSAFTVRKPDPEEADAVLRAKALLARASWPGGHGDA